MPSSHEALLPHTQSHSSDWPPPPSVQGGIYVIFTRTSLASMSAE